jgi:large subunit ribosomal protein L30
MAQIKVTQYRSGIDRPLKQKRILKSLGLHRNQTSRVHDDTPIIRGMVAKIPHLVRIDQVAE